MVTSLHRQVSFLECGEKIFYDKFTLTNSQNSSKWYSLVMFRLFLKCFFICHKKSFHHVVILNNPDESLSNNIWCNSTFSKFNLRLGLNHLMQWTDIIITLFASFISSSAMTLASPGCVVSGNTGRSLYSYKALSSLLSPWR